MNYDLTGYMLDLNRERTLPLLVARPQHDLEWRTVSQFSFFVHAPEL